MWMTKSISSMGVAPSQTLSPNIAETKSQQDHWLCELSPVAPARPCLALPCPTLAGRGAEADALSEGRCGDGGGRNGAAPSGPHCQAGAEADALSGAGTVRGIAHGATPSGPHCQAGQRRTHYRGSANPRQEAGNHAKTGISDAINACHTFGKIRKNNRLEHKA